MASEKFKEVFDDNFFDKVTARIGVLENRELKGSAVIATLWLVLAISLLPTEVKYNFFGFTSDSVKALREVLLAMQAALGGYVSFAVRQEMSFLKEMVRARDEKLSAGNEDAKNILFLAHGIGISHHWTPLPEDKQVRPSWWPVIVSALRDFIGLAFMLTLLVVVVAVQLLVMLQIFEHPNFSRAISVLIIAFAFCVDLIVFLGWYSRKGIYPFWDKSPGAQRVSIFGTVLVIWFLVKIIWKAKRNTRAMKKQA